MNTPLRRIILWILTATGAFVGVWALVFPREFHESFPGLGFGARAADGPFNEHISLALPIVLSVLLLIPPRRESGAAMAGRATSAEESVR